MWSSSTQLRFAGGTGASSHLSEGGDEVVSVVALDDALPSAPVNMLKMDVEGAEIEALNGARELIARQRPCLAISAYHEPEHLWAILLHIKTMEPAYTFSFEFTNTTALNWWFMRCHPPKLRRLDGLNLMNQNIFEELFVLEMANNH